MNHNTASPEDWVVRFAPLVPAGGRVLDLACGGGRHTLLFLARGHPVTAVDRDVSGLADLGERPELERIQADLENAPWPLAGRTFAALVVVNYLHRPLLPLVARSLDAGGVLLYQTFAVGNQRFGKPSNPDFLLKPNELLDAFGEFQVVAYEAGEVSVPRPAVIQRICVVNRPTAIPRLDPARPR